MRVMVLLLTLSFVLPLASSAGNIPLGQPFTLAPQEVVNVGNLPLIVRFDEILGDSRCPLDVLCFWEGEATSQVTLDIPSGDETGFELHTPFSPFGETTAEFHGHVITLLEVSPYPAAVDEPIEPSDYRVRLVVEAVSTLPTEPSSWSMMKARFR